MAVAAVYNPTVDTPLARDTAPDIEQRQIDSWRQMTASQKLRLVVSTSATVRQLAMAGVRQRYPAASSREQFLRLAQVTLGEELARKAYPEIETLDRT